MKPSVNVLYFPGTNCQRETLRAFTLVGAYPRQVFVSDVIAGKDRMDDADILCVPGGFTFGDHVRAGVIAGTVLSTALGQQLDACRKRPVICICNGFQIGLSAGLFGTNVTLTTNECGTFQNRPQQHHVVPQNHSTIWLKGLEGKVLTFPCAHAEGRFIYRSQNGWVPSLYYPSETNPDGSMDDIAGISTPDGLVFGLMDHPERATFLDENLEIFENGVRAVRGN